ncbi:hypothetical protein [Borreliella burgdorferi]|uniref:hypothetical protein n=2 Tax=Borreliella burgdorferi TaxID=139 RepID=UPI001E451D72|nr:hypothetical protein [Borreliella burgdorferi]
MIKNSSEKIYSVFQTLINIGYNATYAAKSNLKNGLKMVKLLDELLKISVSSNGDKSNQKYNELKTVVNKFNAENSAIKVPLENGSKIEAKKCIKTLMTNVETYFKGVST